MRRKIMTMLAGIAVIGIVLSSMVIAEQPASPAQLQAWESQKASLQAQQQAAQGERAGLNSQQQALQAEINRLQGILDGPFDVVQNPVGAAAAAGGKAVIQGANPLDNRSLQDRAMDNAWVAIQQRNATRDLRDQKRGELARAQARAAQLDGEIAARNDQIAQLDRTITYYRDPTQGDLENERARLENLNRQKPTQDDGGQLDWDKNNTMKRIEELQKEFQQGGGSSSGASTGQPQGAYGTSTSGPQSPLPGYDPSWGPLGYPPTSGPQMPTYEGLQRDLEPQRGHQPSQKSGSREQKHKHSGSKGGCDC